MSQEILDTKISKIVELIYPADERQAKTQDFFEILVRSASLAVMFSDFKDLIRELDVSIMIMGASNSRNKSSIEDSIKKIGDVTRDIKMKGVIIMHVSSPLDLELLIKEENSDYCDINTWFKDLKSLQEKTISFEGGNIKTLRSSVFFTYVMYLKYYKYQGPLVFHTCLLRNLKSCSRSISTPRGACFMSHKLLPLACSG